MNLVAVPLPAPRSLLPQHHPRLHLDDVDLERHALHPELKRLREQLLRPFRPIQPHRLRSHLQPQRPDQSDHSEKMIGMKMREEDLRQRKAHPIAHHLALGALTTLEQQRLAFAHESHGGDVALYSWSRCRGSQEGDGKHGGEYKAARGGTGRQKAARGYCRPMPPSAACCRPRKPLPSNTSRAALLDP